MSKKVQTQLSVAMDTRGAMRLFLGLMLGAIDNKDSPLFDKQDRSWIEAITPDQQKEINELLNLLGVISELNFIRNNRGFLAEVGISLKSKAEAEKVRKRFNELISSSYISSIIEYYFLQDKAPKKVKKVKMSGNLLDQLLKYDYPAERKGKQLELWEDIGYAMREALASKGINKETAVQKIVEGIRLTRAEDKVLNALLQLLNRKSQTTKPEEEDYFTGNQKPVPTVYGGKDTVAPKLLFTLYELTQAYTGDSRPSGKEIINVKRTLQTLASKDFAIRYSKDERLPNGNKKKREIEAFEKLVKILKLTETETSKDNVELSKKTEIVVVLSPIVRDEINTKFIEYPEDLGRRTEIAYGSSFVSEETIRLRNYLLRHKSNKRWSATMEINLERLYYILSEKEMKNYRRSRAAKETDKALETMKTLGLLKDYRLESGAAGQDKVVLEVNREFE